MCDILLILPSIVIPRGIDPFKVGIIGVNASLHLLKISKMFVNFFKFNHSKMVFLSEHIVIQNFM